MELDFIILFLPIDECTHYAGFLSVEMHSIEASLSNPQLQSGDSNVQAGMV